MQLQKRPYYTLEFKQDAAKLILEKNYTYPEASSSLGISISALRRWVTAERGGSPASEMPRTQQKATLSLCEHEELLRLRKEVSRLKMEKDILKKATVFFAKESE